MYEAIDDTGRAVTLRKGTSCEWCGERMFPGARAVTRTYRMGDDFICSRVHLECYEAMREYFARPDVHPSDTFDPGAMVRGKPLMWDEEPGEKT